MRNVKLNLKIQENQKTKELEKYEYDNNMTDEEIEERIQELERLQEQKKRKKKILGCKYQKNGSKC